MAIQMTPALRETIERTWNETQNVREVAMAAQISVASAYNILNQSGLRTPSGKSKGRKFTDQEIIEFCEQNPGTSLTNLSNHFNVWPSTMSLHVKRLGIELSRKTVVEATDVHRMLRGTVSTKEIARQLGIDEATAYRRIMTSVHTLWRGSSPPPDAPMPSTLGEIRVFNEVHDNPDVSVEEILEKVADRSTVLQYMKRLNDYRAARKLPPKPLPKAPANKLVPMGPSASPRHVPSPQPAIKASTPRKYPTTPLDMIARPTTGTRRF